MILYFSICTQKMKFSIKYFLKTTMQSLCFSKNSYYANLNHDLTAIDKRFWRSIKPFLSLARKSNEKFALVDDAFHKKYSFPVNISSVM